MNDGLIFLSSHKATVRRRQPAELKTLCLGKLHTAAEDTHAPPNTKVPLMLEAYIFFEPVRESRCLLLSLVAARLFHSSRQPNVLIDCLQRGWCITHRARVSGAVDADSLSVPVDASTAFLTVFKRLLRVEGRGDGDSRHGREKQGEELHDENCVFGRRAVGREQWIR